MDSPAKDRPRSLTRVLSLTLAGLGLIVLAAACGDNGGDGKATTVQPTATTAAAATGPGISVTSTEITGQSGNVLLVFAMDPATGGPMARVCAPIDSDSFTLDATVMTDLEGGQDPCSGSTAETTFEEGTYTVTAGIYVPGTQTPAAETTTTVSVSGDVSVEIDGSALSQ